MADRPRRIPGQTPEQWSDATRALLDGVVQTTPGDASRPVHLPSVIAHHPTFLGPYLEWAKAVALRGVLPQRTNALIALRTAWHRRSEFEWGVHANGALTRGLLTVDEIGTVLAQTAEGKAKHLAACADCAREFRAWLRGKGRRPSDFGKSDWSELKPAVPSDAAEPLAAYESGLFGNVATARLFAPLREAVARANAAKRSDPALKQPWL